MGKPPPFKHGENAQKHAENYVQNDGKNAKNDRKHGKNYGKHGENYYYGKHGKKLERWEVWEKPWEALAKIGTMGKHRTHCKTMGNMVKNDWKHGKNLGKHWKKRWEIEKKNLGNVGKIWEIWEAWDKPWETG